MIEAYLRANKMFVDYNEVILVEYPIQTLFLANEIVYIF